MTGSRVIRETTQTGCPWSRPRVSLSLSLSVYLSTNLRAFLYLSINVLILTSYLQVLLDGRTQHATLRSLLVTTGRDMAPRARHQPDLGVRL